ncbi:hypothetical protein [Phenylobacterium sp.]|uniref:hypothetical protein n=1 Tax=Phenylobacterium sp. TaxID=1871053 RepID=UPI0025FCFE13|nr:hypothetical protein [Phenylobacterium sp.]
MTGRYPDSPGWKGTETSKEAAAFVAPHAATLEARCEAYIQAHGPASPEEVCAGIAAPGERLLLTTIRARVCGLRAKGRVVESGEYGKGESGKVRVIRWRAATADELSLFLARKAARDEKGEGSANG